MNMDYISLVLATSSIQWHPQRYLIIIYNEHVSGHWQSVTKTASSVHANGVLPPAHPAAAAAQLVFPDNRRAGVQCIMGTALQAAAYLHQLPDLLIDGFVYC